MKLSDYSCEPFEFKITDNENELLMEESALYGKMKFKVGSIKDKISIDPQSFDERPFAFYKQKIYELTDDESSIIKAVLNIEFCLLK
jgi:hypothetical protein